MGRHLGDEDLSELVDGLGSPEAMTHVAACDSCQARRDQWRGNAARLRSPVVAPPGRREEAVAAALAAVGAGVGSEGGTGGSGSIRSPGGPGRAGREPGRRARTLAGLAAAAVVVAGAGVGLSQLHGSSRNSSSTASGGSAAAPSAASAGAGGAGGAPARSQAGSRALLSLGPLDSTPALVAAVDRALSPSGPASSGAQSSGGAAAVTVPSASSGTAEAGGGSTASSPTAGSVAVPSVGQAGANQFAPGPTVATPTTAPGSCGVPARLFPSGSQPRLLMEATAEYRKVPAEVFVFQVGAGRRAVVLATADCAVLAQAAV
ncbi:MAG TPA: hypothetical protein VFH58_03905 [Acidimicrobiales bacterium]|nr:hypothetical protein [Acidimicrobiales bacterium]